MFNSETTSLLFFPKDSESLKLLDIQLWKVGAKRRLSGTSKVNTRTDRQTDISTHGKHPPRGPMLWKYQKWNVNPNHYTRPENLAWSHSVFIQYSLCIKRWFMKPLLLSNIANTGCLFSQSIPPTPTLNLISKRYHVINYHTFCITCPVYIVK